MRPILFAIFVLTLFRGFEANPIDDSDEDFNLDPVLWKDLKPEKKSTESSITPQSCECVLFNLCNNQTLNTNGAGLIEVRFNEGIKCPNLYEVCCPVPLIKIETISRIDTSERKCGKRNADGVGFRITGNSQEEAQFGEFPWMVGIFYDKPHQQKLRFPCGGSLIHPQIVMTGAVCVSDTSKQSSLRVRVGEWDLGNTRELLPHQDLEVRKVIIHEGYGHLKNDIALLFLKSPVVLANNVDTICLPEANTNFDGDRCVVTGWGTGGNGKPVDILKQIQLPIVARQQCLNSLRKTGLGVGFNVHESFICAGGEENGDSCNGDGGGPLVCRIKAEQDRYQQVGIVSFGLQKCGTPGVPAMYTDVAKFREWIDNQIKLEKLII